MLCSCNRTDNTKSSATIQSKHTSITDSSLVWTDYRLGELPPVHYDDALDSIIRKWNINYKRIEGGDDLSNHEGLKYDKTNQLYFKYLETKYGKNWRNRFDKEVAALTVNLQ